MTSRPPTGIAKEYDTRLDRFRVREGIGIKEWAAEAGLRRTTLNRYRSGDEEPTSDYLANLVRSASRILQRSVRASELYDLGETEPLGRKVLEYRSSRGSRRLFESRLDILLRRVGLPPSALARNANMSEHTLLRIRSARSKPMVSSIRDLVLTLRRMGYDVKASDIVDVGEKSHPSNR